MGPRGEELFGWRGEGSSARHDGVSPCCCAAAAAVTAHGAAGRRAGAGAGQAGHALHRHDRVPSHRRHQRRPAGHPVARSKGSATRSTGRTATAARPGVNLRPTHCNHPNKNPRIFTAANLAQLRRDRVPEQLVGVRRRRRRRDRPAARGHAEGRAHRLPAERRRHRRDPQHDRRRRRPVDLGLVGRQPELRHRHDDARPRGHQRHRQRRDRAGRRQQPPVDARTCPTRGRSSDEHYNYLRNVRGGHHVLATFDERTYTPGVNGVGPGPPDHLVQALRRRQHQRRHVDAEDLHATAARGTPAWATSASATPRTAATTTWST